MATSAVGSLFLFLFRPVVPLCFPAIDTFCNAAGVDPARKPIPARPAAHHHMGGIAVDLAGRSSVEGLWACGEAACTGLHGANGLASNSLLEAAIFAHCVAESIAGTDIGQSRRPVAMTLPQPADPAPVRPIASRTLGLMSNGQDLANAAAALLPMAIGSRPEGDAAIAAMMIAIAAHQRRESRGAHFRSDLPAAVTTRIVRV